MTGDDFNEFLAKIGLRKVLFHNDTQMPPHILTSHMESKQEEKNVIKRHIIIYLLIWPIIFVLLIS